eukprot:995347-Pelagomonas_calceolata.AAC.2
MSHEGLLDDMQIKAVIWNGQGLTRSCKTRPTTWYSGLTEQWHGLPVGLLVFKFEVKMLTRSRIPEGCKTFVKQ